MNPGLVVKLRPSGPWRIGPGSGARNRVDVIYHSDSLYSAVTAAMSRLGWIEEWLDATARAGLPVVSFSSCFPYLGGTAFVVPPRTVWPPASPSTRAEHVRWKSARFVPLAVVQSILAGERLDEKEWSVDGPSDCLVPAGLPGPFRTAVRSNASVDRLTGASERHSTACLEFRADSGLWTVVSFADEAAHAEWSEKVKAAFRLLADSGFGGERSRGWGRSEAPEFIEGMLPDLILPPAAEKAAPDPEPVEGAEVVVAAPPSIEPLTVEPEPGAEPEPPPAVAAPEPGVAAAEPAEVAPEPPAVEPEQSETSAVVVPEPGVAVAEPAEVAPEPPAVEPEQPETSAVAAPEPGVAVVEPVEVAPESPAVEPEQPETSAVAVPEPEVFVAEPQEAAPESPAVEPEPAAPEPETPAVEPEAPEPSVVAEAPAAELPAAAVHTHPHWLLSLFTPAAADAVDWRRGNYTVLPRVGRIDSPAGSGELKKQIQMVAEGSVLYAEAPPRGTAADVAPDGFAHPVFRSGFALAIPLPEVR